MNKIQYYKSLLSCNNTTLDIKNYKIKTKCSNGQHISFSKYLRSEIQIPIVSGRIIRLNDDINIETCVLTESGEWKCYNN